MANLSIFLLVVSFLFLQVTAGELHVNDFKERGSLKIKEETLDYIYEWIYRIANPNYFNQKYFKDGIFDGRKGLFILDMVCIKDYYGDFYLKIKKKKYLRSVPDKYRYIPISKVDSSICIKDNERYTARLYEKIIDQVTDIKNNRVCYLSALTFCVTGRKRLCKELVESSYTCVKSPTD